MEVNGLGSGERETSILCRRCGETAVQEELVQKVQIQKRCVGIREGVRNTQRRVQSSLPGESPV